MAEQHVEFRHHRATAERWLEVDPVLDETEIGYERGTGKFKVGDGQTKWSALPYFTPGDSIPGGPTSQELIDHVNAAEPHPVYDNGPSLTLLYQNAKV